MRKPRSNYSGKAKQVLERAAELGIAVWSDPDWSLVEAAGIETPSGEVHLHWKSHHGRGNWNIVTNPQWRGEICGTVRCRRVEITPHGGDNEAVPLNAMTLDQAWDAWWEKKYPGITSLREQERNGFDTISAGVSE